MDRNYLESNRQLTHRDIRAVLTISPGILVRSVDILTAIDTLARSGFLDKTSERMLLNKYSSQRDLLVVQGGRFKAFLFDIAGRVSFPQLIQCLASIGCSFLVTELFRCRDGIPSYPSPAGQETTSSTYLIRLHSQLKTKLDNNEFPDKFQALLSLSENIWHRQRDQRGLRGRQLLVDSFAVVIWLLIHTYRDENVDLKMATLNSMMAKIPRDLDPSFSMMVYLGRTAVTFATANDWQRVNYYESEAKTVFCGSGKSFAKMLLIHDLQLVSRFRETRFRSQDDTASIVHRGDIALEMLDAFPHVERYMWDRIIRLNMIQALLGIKVKLVVDYNNDADSNAMTGARSLLEIVGSPDIFSSIECRREMIFSLCKAVHLELRGNLPLALTFANRAIALSENGRLFPSDCKNVRRFQERLYKRMLPIETETQD